MKDKEKIEEMAKDLKEVETDVGHILINETFSYVKEHKKYNPKKDFSNAHTKTFEELTAEEMFKKGYRKFSKDSVVLSREEQEKILQATENRINKLKEQVKQANKETAEKFANRLIEIFSTAMGVCSGCALQHDKAKNPTAREFQFGKYKGLEVAIKEVKELAKQFGVEIKE